MKNNLHIFAFNNKLVEHESLLEVRAGTTTEEWNTIIGETVDSFCLMTIGKRLGPPMQPADLRIYRRLKKTIELFKKLDPVIMINYNIEEICNDHIEKAKKGWDEHTREIRVANGKPGKGINADIFVSDL